MTSDDDMHTFLSKNKTISIKQGVQCDIEYTKALVKQKYLSFYNRFKVEKFMEGMKCISMKCLLPRSRKINNNKNIDTENDVEEYHNGNDNNKTMELPLPLPSLPIQGNLYIYRYICMYV
jgi:hypothetical protein